jgi:hypothetical protein
MADEEGHSDRRFEIGHLVPQAALAQHVSMVSAKDHHSVVVKTTFLEYAQKLANAVINIADSTIVRAPCTLNLLVCKLVPFKLTNVQESSAVRVLVFLFHTWHLRHVYLYSLIHVPVLVLDCVGVVGMGEGDCQAEGASSLPLPDVVVQILLRLVQDFFVVI